mmetsp:Transcript_27006/g.80469  ORF Transcript_27006/g.80469 Transcript_27006/m.80469 type:complete len:200 (+) Transcript_27006:705-1304(+)
MRQNVLFVQVGVERNQPHEAFEERKAEHLIRVQDELLAIVLRDLALHGPQGGDDILVRHVRAVDQRCAEVRKLRRGQVRQGRLGVRDVLGQVLRYKFHNLLVEAGLLATPVCLHEVNHPELVGDKAKLHRHQLPGLVQGRARLLCSDRCLRIARSRPGQGGGLDQVRALPARRSAANLGLDLGGRLERGPLLNLELLPC